MDFKYEMKIDHPQSSTIWAEIEILDIIKESNEFLIKYSKNEKLETIRNIVIKPINESSSEIESIEKNSLVEIFLDNIPTRFSNITGWIEGEVKDIKGEFILVEYQLENQKHSQIFPKNLLRKSSQTQDNLDLNLNLNNHFSYNLDFLNGLSNKIRKIKNLIINLKTIVQGIKLIFYSISSNDFVIFPDNNFASIEEKTEAFNLLDTLMNTITDFYVELRQEKQSTEIEDESGNEKNYSNIQTKKKKPIQKEEKDYIYFDSMLLEKFILETVKPKIESYKKNSLVKIEHKNTKNPNVIRLEIKSNDLKLFEKVKEDLNVIQKYFQLNLNDRDPFLLGDSNQPNSLKYYIHLFGIYSYHIFKLDENNITLRLIGREREIELVAALLNEFVNSRNSVAAQENELKVLQTNSNNLAIQKV